MIRHCLDTSAYSHFKRGDAEVVALIDQAEWLGIPTIVLGELWLGFLNGGNFERNRTQLDEFLSHPVVEVLGLDLETAAIYGELMLDLRRAGTPVPSNDVWIAACAARAGSAVLTYDAHFRLIRRVGTTVLPHPDPS